MEHAGEVEELEEEAGEEAGQKQSRVEGDGYRDSPEFLLVLTVDVTVLSLSSLG